MPTRFNTNYLRLKDDDEFEELLRDIVALEWQDAGAQRNGRSGQKQWGVDVYGQPRCLEGGYYGVQCKLRPSQAQLTETEIEHEVKEARSFPHQLVQLIIATDTPRDNNIQILVDKISEREISNGGFAVKIWFWPEIERKIATYPRILVKYYHDHLSSLTNIDVLDRLIDRPLQVVLVNLLSSTNTTPLDQRLQFRGIQMVGDIFSPIEIRTADFHELLPDGIVCLLDLPAVADTNKSVLRFISKILSLETLVETSCPVCIVLPSVWKERFITHLRDLHRQPGRFLLFTDDLNVNEMADRIFTAVFTYGYQRRGTIPTIHISARSRQNKPMSALLDLDWHTHLSTEYHPTESEWHERFAPALRIVANHLTALRVATQILVDSDLPLPASVALGFRLNLRLAIIGVWGRRMGKSDSKQLWLSDSEATEIEVTETWFEKQENGTGTAILELSSGFSIHASVKAFVGQHGLTPDIWLEANLSTNEGIEEAQAIAYANYVGRLMRQLTVRGITDTHLFLRVPTALGVFIGQKLHACGRIHLYWFDNKNYSYKPAFMLA